MSAHTPGPWEPSTDAHGRGRIYGGGAWLATTWLATGDSNNAPALPAVANAQLIAASPDLLAAAYRAAAALESVSYSDPSITSALAVVNAAIAKATGEAA